MCDIFSEHVHTSFFYKEAVTEKHFLGCSGSLVDHSFLTFGGLFKQFRAVVLNLSFQPTCRPHLTGPTSLTKEPAVNNYRARPVVFFSFFVGDKQGAYPTVFRDYSWWGPRYHVQFLCQGLNLATCNASILPSVLLLHSGPAVVGLLTPKNQHWAAMFRLMWEPEK